ncbi:uncharacterized protein CXorf38 homolog [Rhinophrynus dorsalis]
MAPSGLLHRLNCIEYKNWIKAGQCLLLLKGSLQEYIAREMEIFHKQLVCRIPPPRVRCQCRAKGKQFQPVCPACAEWKRHILGHHSLRNAEIYWGNCNPSLWSTHYWEVAKAYMPRGHADKKGPQQCDAAALLNLINACDHFRVCDLSKVREVIKCRNDIMHSSDMKVSAAWLGDFGNKMQNFISEFKHIPGLKEQGGKIQEVLLSDWAVEDLDEFDALALACDKEIPISLGEVEMELIQQMIQEINLQIEDCDTLSNEDLDNIQKLKTFLFDHKDLQSHFQGEVEKLDSMLQQMEKVMGFYIPDIVKFLDWGNVPNSRQLISIWDPSLCTIESPAIVTSLVSAQRDLTVPQMTLHTSQLHRGKEQFSSTPLATQGTNKILIDLNWHFDEVGLAAVGNLNPDIKFMDKRL